jgi:hypothetical protein
MFRRAGSPPALLKYIKENIMALPAPTNFDADYEAIAGDQFCVTTYWEPVPGAHHYIVYRDQNSQEVYPAGTVGQTAFFSEITRNGAQMLAYRDTEAWFAGQSLDLFYWVRAIELDPITNLYVDGDLSDAITNLHPFGLRIIEEARSIIGDDIRMFNEQKAEVAQQVSIYNWKLAMDQALSAVNMTPTFTTHSYGTFPFIWKNLLTLGTLYYILPKLILLEKAKSMSFNDQGQEWTPPDISAALEKLRDDIKTDFNDLRKEIKHNVRPTPLGVGSLRALFISPQLLKWRHVPTGRNFF